MSPCFTTNANLILIALAIGGLHLLGFKLIELHLSWAALKEHGRVAAQNIPLPVQSALTTLGLASLDWVTQDLVITEEGLVGPRKRLP
jgi:hypothetical protein